MVLEPFQARIVAESQISGIAFLSKWYSPIQHVDFPLFLSILDALPEGLTRELPTADEFQKIPVTEPATTTFDDIEELRKQLDALNAD